MCEKWLRELEYDWPQNIRELDKLMKNVDNATPRERGEITLEDLRRCIVEAPPGDPLKATMMGAATGLKPVQEMEAEQVMAALNEAGSIRGAGERLKERHEWVRRRIGKYGIERSEAGVYTMTKGSGKRGT